MRVLFITGSFPPMQCGVGDYTAHLAGRLAATAGVAVAVLTSREAGAYAGNDGIELLPLVDGWNILSLGTILQTIREWRPDLVHLQYPTAGYGRVFLPNMLPLLLKLGGRTVVQTWHELPIYSFFLNALTRDIIIAVEPDFAAIVPWYYRRFLSRKKLEHIPIASNIPQVSLSNDERQKIRAAHGCATERLIVYFGFAHKAKGVDALFRIAQPGRDRLLLICDLDPADSYQREILALMSEKRWSGMAQATGHLPATGVARLLAAADAVLLPFETGVSSRNGSFLAAREQGAFVVTTHRRLRGLSPDENVFYAAPGDDASMRAALHTPYVAMHAIDRSTLSWDEIAEAHLRLYREYI